MSRHEPARQQSRDWEETYRELADHELPWFWDELDGDFAKILSGQDTQGRRLLDLGTGQGNQAVALAELGYEVIGLDLSKEAVKRAQALAQEAGSPARFKQFDLLKEDLDEAPFDLILDRGCFHVFNAEGRSIYAQKVKKWLKPDGQILIKSFSYKQPGTDGPNRLHPDDFKAAFEPQGLLIQSITETHFFGNHDPFPQALFAVVRVE